MTGAYQPGISLNDSSGSKRTDEKSPKQCLRNRPVNPYPATRNSPRNKSQDAHGSYKGTTSDTILLDLFVANGDHIWPLQELHGVH